MNSKAISKDAHVSPEDVAQALRESVGQDAPNLQVSDVLTWGQAIGMEADLRRALDPAWTPARYDLTGEVLKEAPLKVAQIREAMGVLVSNFPEQLREKEEAVGKLQRWWLKRQAEKLEGCGKPWRNYVVRMFWRDAKGRERMRRQMGIHRCKGAWCPSCGRSRQERIAGEVEKQLILAEDWGFNAGHARMVTLTSPNGDHIPTLREQTHEAFARLENTRWWTRRVFGFVRGTEVVTGKDGNWNFHIHLLVIFWSSQIDYADIQRAWTLAMDGKGSTRRYVVDVTELEAEAWARKDGKEGPLARRNLVRAARYISKYLCKGEDLAKLRGGPGGLAHLVSGTKGMRRAAFGGGCAVLRRLAAVLMPKELHAAEAALAETPLHEGRGPVRAEVMDPETGEVVDHPFTAPNDERTRALRALGEVLETNPEPKRGWKLPGRVVGVPCGPKGRHRRIGAVPLASRQPRVREFEAWQRNKAKACPLTGVRAVVAGGDWVVERSEHTNQKGQTHKFTAVLPARRYSWRAVQAVIWAQLPAGVWAPIWAKAHAAHAREIIGSREREDALRAVTEGLVSAGEAAKRIRSRCARKLWKARRLVERRGGTAAREQVKRLEQVLETLKSGPKSLHAVL